MKPHLAKDEIPKALSQGEGQFREFKKQALRVVGYEQRFRAEATLDDLDLELAHRFLDRTPVGARPVKEALEYYGLIERHLTRWMITNAGLLLSLATRAP